MKLMAEKRDRISLLCTVATNDKSPSQFVNQFLFLLYLGLNIAEPGSASIFAQISCLNNENSEQKDFDFAISSEPFEFIEGEIREHNYPRFCELDFSRVWKWLEINEINKQPVAKTNTQRSVFALLNSCIGENFTNPTGLLWLALGLEALYDLPSLGISSALRERIFLTLGVPENSTKVKRTLSGFYNLRLKFVHGKLEMVNPTVGSSYLTDDVFEAYEVPIIDASNFARAVLVSTLQKMVFEDWNNLNFQTILYGTK